MNKYPPLPDPRLASESLVALASLRYNATIQNETKFVDPGKFLLIPRHTGNYGSDESNHACDKAISWEPSMYTGYVAPDPKTSYQRGYKDESGQCIYQSCDNTVGALLNTWTFDHTQPVTGGGPQVVLSYNFPDLSNRVWSNSGSLIQRMNLQVPWSMMFSGGVAQICFVTYIVDTLTKTSIGVVTQVFDSRVRGNGNGTEVVGSDTITPFVSTFLGDDTRYVSIHPESSKMQNVDPFKKSTFAFVLDADNLTRIVADVKKLQPNISTKIADYALSMVGMIAEAFVGTSPECNASIGFNVSDFAAYQYNKSNTITFTHF